jgi:glyoxylase-like metal-dependent hydrolase (beta-lactamase superfamily II)
MRRFTGIGAAVLSLVAVAGPLLLGILIALYVGRPSPDFLLAGTVLTIVLLLCDGWIIARRRWIIAGIALASQTLLLIFVSTYAASPLSAPAPLSESLPNASPPSDMAIYALPTGINHRTAAFAYRGGSPWDKRDSVSTAVLVQHPQGDLLIDTGIGAAITEQMKAFPLLFRLGTESVRLRTAAQQLDSSGYDRKRLRYILLTHAHWDHLSGVPDFPGVPVLVTSSERRFIDEGGWATANARGMKVVFQEYSLNGGPYMGFNQSRDLYGDGSIVIVPAPGHTPGSVVVFVTLPSGARYAFVGDLVWQLEGLLKREERPWFESRTLGENQTVLRQSLLQMSAIAERYPQITIVPSHDPRGYVSIPEWPRSAAR